MKSGIGYILVLVGIGIAGIGLYCLWEAHFSGKPFGFFVDMTKVTIFYSIWTAVGLAVLFGGVKLAKSSTKAN
jgi:hypothetical protein